MQELRERLIGRGTDTLEKIEQRVAKAEYEMTFAPQFDTIVINDKVEDAYADAERVIREFISK